METKVKVIPRYASINAIRDICEPWIAQWGGDEWGESMQNLHGAAHTSYGLSDEDCATVAEILVREVVRMKDWVDTEGQGLEMDDPDDMAATRAEATRARDYWLGGGNIKSEPHITDARETIETMPTWMFEEEG